MIKSAFSLLWIVTVIVVAAEPNNLVAKDSNGIVVEIKEKYGVTVLDTATAVIYHEGNFVVIHREGVAAWYPASFHSVRVLERLNEANGTASKRLDKDRLYAEKRFLKNQSVN